MDPVAVSEFDWFRINISDNLNWDTILINAFVNVNENFSKSVRRLLSS